MSKLSSARQQAVTVLPATGAAPSVSHKGEAALPAGRRQFGRTVLACLLIGIYFVVVLDRVHRPPTSWRRAQPGLPKAELLVQLGAPSTKPPPSQSTELIWLQHRIIGTWELRAVFTPGNNVGAIEKRFLWFR